MKNRRSNTLHAFRNLTFAAIVFGLLAFGAWLLFISEPATVNDSKAASSINNSPATSQDQSFSDSKKDRQPVTNSDKPANNSPDRKKVEVTITTYNANDSGYLSVNGYVSDIVENDGTCTLTLTDSANKSVATTRKGLADATTTTCGESTVALSELHPGTWRAVLSYSSDTSIGTSEPVNIEVE